MAKREDGDKRELLGFVGIGLDNEDEHQRLTRSEHFLIVGGSAATHERMQDTVIRFDDKLKQKGKTLSETEAAEALDILRAAMED